MKSTWKSDRVTISNEKVGFAQLCHDDLCLLFTILSFVVEGMSLSQALHAGTRTSAALSVKTSWTRRVGLDPGRTGTVPFALALFFLSLSVFASLLLVLTAVQSDRDDDTSLIYISLVLSNPVASFIRSEGFRRTRIT